MPPRTLFHRITVVDLDNHTGRVKCSCFVHALNSVDEGWACVAFPEPSPVAPIPVYLKMLTARAMTRPRTSKDATDWRPMASFAQCFNGMTSVGLKARLFVNPR